MTSDLPVMPGVEFRPAAGRPGYAVGDDGSIWSNRHSGQPRGAGISGSAEASWHRLAAGASSARPTVRLVVEDGYVSVTVARVVLEAFGGPGKAGLVPAHRDGDARNVRPDNLYWSARRRPRGTPPGKHRRDRGDWAEVRRRHTAGESATALASAYGVSVSTIHYQLRQRTKPLPPDAARLPGRLRALIERYGASQAAVARSAGVPVPNLCDYLAGRKAVTDDTLARLLAALGRSWADLDEPA